MGELIRRLTGVKHLDLDVTFKPKGNKKGLVYIYFQAIQ